MATAPEDDAPEASRRHRDARRCAGRRLAWFLLTIVVVGGAVVGYLLWRDWPGWSISLWDRAQELLGFLPELP